MNAPLRLLSFSLLGHLSMLSRADGATITLSPGTTLAVDFTSNPLAAPCPSNSCDVLRLSLVLSSPKPPGTMVTAVLYNGGVLLGSATSDPAVGPFFRSATSAFTLGSTVDLPASQVPFSGTFYVATTNTLSIDTTLTNVDLGHGTGTATFSFNPTTVQFTSITLLPAQADLSITKIAPPFITGGQNSTYMLTVTNNGPSQATDVTVNDTPPPGFTFVSSSGGCTAFPCNLGTLDNGQSVTINVTFSVPAILQGTSNTATVFATTHDPNLANNTATVSNVPARTPIPATLLLVCLALSALALSRFRHGRRLR